MKEQMLRLGSYCGGKVFCRQSGLPQAENPRERDSYLGANVCQPRKE